MKLEKMPRTSKGGKKRLGRGYGSGKGGHTVGRGAKGDKARGKTGLIFTGTKAKKAFFKRLPFLRGKGKFKQNTRNSLIVNLKFLNILPPKTVVDVESLIKNKIVRADDAHKFGVKILGDGELQIPLTVNLPVSKSAAEKIKKAGGAVGGEKAKAKVRRKNKL
jgi:large subunit ribosomal protein L15